MAKKATTKGVNEFARELGVAPPTVSRKRLEGKSDDQIRQEAEEWKLSKVRQETGKETRREADARKAIADADLKELELAEKRGQVVSYEDVNAWVSGMILKARDILLRIGLEKKDDLALETDPVKCQEIIDTHIHRALRELTEFRK